MSGVSQLLTGYLNGTCGAHKELENFLLSSEHFWDNFFLDITNCFLDDSLTQLSLLLFSRRLRTSGCDDDTANFLINFLLPLANESENRCLLTTVLAAVVAQAPLDVSAVVFNILNVAESAPLFCLSFLTELAESVNRMASLTTTLDDVMTGPKVEQKRQLLLDLNSNVLSYCYEMLATVSKIADAVRVESVRCVTAWLTADFLPPRVIEEKRFLYPPASTANLSDSSSYRQPATILDAIVRLTLEAPALHCNQQNTYYWIGESEPLLASVTDFLEALFVRCWEGRRYPEAQRGSLDPAMRMSEAATTQLTALLVNIVTIGVPTFRKCLLISPESCFGVSFLPDRYSFETTSGSSLDITNAAVTTTATTRALTAMTRLLVLSVKLMMASSLNPFTTYVLSDVLLFQNDSTDRVEVNKEEVAVQQVEIETAVELLTGLVTACGQRDISIAAMALEGCLYAHHRTTPSTRCYLQGWYRLLLQVALRHCCSVYSGQEQCDDSNDMAKEEVCGCPEWVLVRQEILHDVVCIVYQELRGEFLAVSSEVMQTYLMSVHEKAMLSSAVSVVTGVVFSLHMVSADMTRRCLVTTYTPSLCSLGQDDMLTDAVETTQYLLEFLQSVFSHTATSSQLASPSAPVSPMHHVLGHTAVVAAVNQLLGSLSVWVSNAQCFSWKDKQLALMPQSGIDGEEYISPCFPPTQSEQEVVDVFDELGGECLQVEVTINYGTLLLSSYVLCFIFLCYGYYIMICNILVLDDWLFFSVHNSQCS